MARKKYSVETVKTDLQLEEDLDLQESAWKWQRVGFVFIYLIVLLGAIGLFGNGLVSTKTIRHENAEIEYERFFRHEANMEVKISVNNSSGSIATVSFPNTYLENFRIESIFPEPKQNKFLADHVEYTFDGSDHMNIVFYLSPKKTGNASGNIKVNNVDYSLNHFIYP